MAEAVLYARRFWKYSTLLRQLDRDGGDEDTIQDCLNELEANALHAPSSELRARSQAAIDAHFAVEPSARRGNVI